VVAPFALLTGHFAGIELGKYPVFSLYFQLGFGFAASRDATMIGAGVTPD
jgi:hypothetical protein